MSPTDNSCPVPRTFRERFAPVLFISALFFLSFMARVIFAPLMPTLEGELGLNHSQAGSLFLMISLGFFVAQISSGFVSSHLSHKAALNISALGIGVALLCFGFSRSLGSIRLVMLLLGLAAGFHVPSAIATITAMVSRKDWGKALGMHQTAPSLSLVLAPLFVQWLVVRLSWWVILVWLAALSLVVAILFVIFARSGDFRGAAPGSAVVKAVAGQGAAWIMVLLFALAIGGSVGLYSMLPLYLVCGRGFEPGWANMILGLSRISGLVMAFVAGLLTDRVGEKRALSAVFLSAGILTILLGVAPDSWLVWIIFFQAAVVVCFFPPGFSALSRIVPPNLRSVTTSMVTPTAFLLGGGAVPTFIGYMGEKQAFGLGIALIGGLMLLSPLVIRFLALREEEEDGC